MGWIATVDVTSEQSEAAMSRLWDLGTDGIAELDTPTGLRLLAGFASEVNARAAIEALGFGGTVRPVDPTTWGAPTVTEISISGSPITIDAQHAFGHGGHPTTRLCLEALERTVEPGMSVLDVGTGSGVLALAARSLGAGDVLGIDLDAEAIGASRANATRNDMDVDFETMTAGDVSRTFDLVVVNMLIAELEPIGAHIRRAADGPIVVSGCLDHQVHRVVPALRAPGQGELTVHDHRVIDDWVGLVLR